jgi:type IV pilus assembly protein PilE
MAANHATRRRNRGFTLVELIVAMVILATLAAIAIPSYSSYVLKSHRTEAKSALLDAASLEERFFSTNNTYTGDPQQLGYGVATMNFPVGNGAYYIIQSINTSLPIAPNPPASPGGTPATYVITAVPNPASMQISDTQCWTWTISSTGQQTALTQGGTDNTPGCWQN